MNNIHLVLIVACKISVDVGFGGASPSDLPFRGRDASKGISFQCQWVDIGEGIWIWIFFDLGILKLINIKL